MKYGECALWYVMLALGGCAGMHTLETKVQDMTKRAHVAVYKPSGGVARSHRPSGAKAVLTGGCFDILHIGHIRYLELARKHGDYLIVALEPDSRITHYKKRKPVHTQEQRGEVLSQLRCVDEVLLLPELSGFEAYKKLVMDVDPAVIAVTAGDPQLENKRKQAQAVGCRVEEVTPLVADVSSTAILEKL